MSKVKVLVTGAAGYVGSTLCQRLLRDDFEVVGLDSCIYNNEQAIFGLLGDSNFTFSLFDVRDEEAMRAVVQTVDAVIPLAAVVGAPACDAKPAYAKAVNLTAIRQLVNHLSPNQRIIYPNTNSGYGQTDGKEEVTEEGPLAPVSLYGRTKVEAEKIVLDHPQGVTLRLATVFGPSPRMRFDLLVNEYTRCICMDGKLEVFDPHYKRNFVHVRDVARVFVRMLADHRLKGTYNVGLPEANLSKLELAYFVAGCMGVYPMDAVTVGEGTDPDQRNYLVSNAKLLATGFKFKHDLKCGIEGVAQMVSLLTPPAIQRMRNAA